MRPQSFYLCLLMLFACVSARGDVMSEYQAVTGRMTGQAIESAWFKEPGRWKRVWIEYRFNVTDDGRIRNVKITTKIPNRWAEDTARRTLLALRFPPVPKEVLKLTGYNGLYSSGGLRLEK